MQSNVLNPLYSTFYIKIILQYCATSYLAHTYMLFKHFAVFSVLCFFLTNTGFGQSTFTNQYGQGLVQYQLHILKDEEGLLQIEDVTNPGIQHRFEPLYDKNINYKFSTAAFWIRLSIAPVQPVRTNYYFSLGYPLLDSIHIYSLSPTQKWQLSRLGDMYPYTSRPIDHRLFLHELELEEGTTATYYIRVRTSSSVVMPMDVLSSRELHQLDNRADVAYGILYGILLVMILYNLFIYVSLRDVNYVFYSLSIVGSFLFFFTNSGHLNQFLFTTQPWMANKIMIVFMGFLSVASAIFARSFLNLQLYSKVLDNLLRFALLMGALIMLLAFVIDYSIAVRTAMFLLLGQAFLLLICGTHCWRKGNKSARFFVIGWFVYLLGGMAIALRNIGLLPHTVLTSHAVEIGSALEVIFLSLALGDKYRLLRMDNEESQLRALEVQLQANEALEHKVKERTAEINQQKAELELHRDSIEKQNRVLEVINFEVQRHSEKITSSIQYAKRIQEAILKHEDKIARLFPQHFIVYKPRDIVSGDFYWLSEIQVPRPIVQKVAGSAGTSIFYPEHREEYSTKIILAAIDCTGHGVPGAFMSLIGDALLNQIVNEKKITSPDLILNHLHASVRSLLNQNSSHSHDGMDVALCVIDKAERTLEYAGARNPLVYFRHHAPGAAPAAMEVIKGNRISVGGTRNETRAFTKHCLRFDTPVTLYLFSDGYQDQFGGEKNKKFMAGQFKKLLCHIHHLPLPEQKEILENTMEHWMKGGEQVDDMLVMGVRI
jgi:two-component system, sensor histidine kinase LadS